METRNTLCLFTLLVITAISCSTAFTEDYFTVAIYEHVLLGKKTTDSPKDRVLSNLKRYEAAVRVAKSQNADLILFPEYGLIPPTIDDTSESKSYMELIPDPKETIETPCNDFKRYSSRPILFALSCMAKRNKIVTVGNLGGRQPCLGQSDCPEDGEFYFNANVAFDQNGTLVGRYYKEHLFYEFDLDLPKEKQDPVFETNFGKFAMFICFDIMFKKMATVSRLKDVDATLFSSLFGNFSPFFSSIQWFQAFAMGNNATLIAANMQIPGYGATGSGVFLGRKGSIVNAFNPDGISKLVVTTVPKRDKNITSKSKIFAITENGAYEWNGNGKDLPFLCSRNILGKSKDETKDYRCFDQDVTNYTLKQLTGPTGNVKVCNEGMCCELSYLADDMDESFYLGVFNGTRTYFERYFFSEESCFLARCDDVNSTSCSLFAMYSKTVFRRIFLKATFSTKYVYPSVMSSGMNLVPVQSWTYTARTNVASIELNSKTGIRLLQATLMGRVYDKDPPYVK